MRNIFFTILVALGFAQMTLAQSPNSFSYQAVVRDASGNTTNNQSVAFRISILKTTASGTSVYSETHTATSNDFGLVNLEIGGGTTASGNFSTINWGTDDYFVKVELDAAGGTNYITMGTSQLLSVPFAMYAKTSGDKVWAKAGNNAQLTNGAVGIGTAATGYALTLRAIGSNALIKGNNVSGQTLLNINTAGGHPFLKLNNNTGSVEKISLNTNGNSFFNGGNLGLGTTAPARKLHVSDAMRLEPLSSAPSNPSKGDMYFNGTSNKLMVYDGTTWQACW